MRFFRKVDNRNTITGIFLLVLLAVIAGPNTLPRLIARIIPFADEGIPCQWLAFAEDRSQHQSLIGRAAENPIAIGVRSTPLPTTPDGSLVISITVINTSIGTIPFVYNPNQVIVGDNNTSGIGITFNPPNGLTTGAVRQDSASYPESDLRLLGPRQRCVHKVVFAASQLGALGPQLATGTATVTAFYRNNNRGQIIPTGTQLFTDQGLWTGIVLSEPALIPLASQ
jgi:hypothetical protein